jgi:hypothetical protein
MGHGQLHNYANSTLFINPQEQNRNKIRWILNARGFARRACRAGSLCAAYAEAPEDLIKRNSIWIASCSSPAYLDQLLTAETQFARVLLFDRLQYSNNVFLPLQRPRENSVKHRFHLLSRHVQSL